MESYLLKQVPENEESLVVEGYHKPGSLTQASGTWISGAGSFVLGNGTWPLNHHDQWVWLLVESGAVTLDWDDKKILIQSGNACFLPCGEHTAVLSAEEDVRCLWMALEGPLAALVVRKMGALLHMPIAQKTLPSQVYVMENVVRVIVRHSGASNATYHLQYLLYGLIATHEGMPVSMDAMLSHEIAKVIDTMRANHYRENLSLAQMAAISRMPMETFRKRFVSEVGMPPLSYVLYCKMERAKELLREQKMSVREVGAAVGMTDPYHFSKQFKNIVGISPTAYTKHTTVPDATIRGSFKKPRKKRRKA